MPIALSPTAERDLDRLGRKDRTLAQRVLKALLALATDPKPPASRRLSGNLSGARGLRVGPIRVLYDWQPGDEVRIESVSRRSTCYGRGHRN